MKTSPHTHRWFNVGRLVMTEQGRRMFRSRVCEVCGHIIDPGTERFVVGTIKDKPIAEEVRHKIKQGWGLLNQAHNYGKGGQARKVILIHPAYLWKEEDGMIQGLTTQEVGRLPVEFQLRKGSKKKTVKSKKTGKMVEIMGDDLDHFRFVPSDLEDSELVETFMQCFGEAPRQLEVFMPYDEIEDCFESSMIEFDGSYGIVHQCDGAHLLVRDPITGRFVITEEPCPYTTLEINDRRRKCKPHGSLFFIIKPVMDRLQRGFSGVVHTTSIHDLRNIWRSLVYWAGPGQPYEGKLKGMPFILNRELRTISTPTEKGKIRTDKWLVFLRVSPRFVESMLASGSPSPRAIGPSQPEEGKLKEKPEVKEDWEKVFLQNLDSLHLTVGEKVYGCVVRRFFKEQGLQSVSAIPDRKTAGILYKALFEFGEIKTEMEMEGHPGEYEKIVNAVAEEDPAVLKEILVDALKDMLGIEGEDAEVEEVEVEEVDVPPPPTPENYPSPEPPLAEESAPDEERKEKKGKAQTGLNL